MVNVSFVIILLKVTSHILYSQSRKYTLEIVLDVYTQTRVGDGESLLSILTYR